MDKKTIYNGQTRFINCGLYDDTRPVAWHSHDSSEIIFVVRGSCSIDAGGTRLTGAEGALFVIPPEMVHNQINHGEIQNFYCMFETEAEKYTSRPCVLDLGHDYWLERWLNDMATLNNAFNTELCHGLMDSLLQRIEQLKNDQDHEYRLPPLLFKALRYVRSRYHEALTLEDIAANAAISVSYLKILFHRHLAVSPIQYVQQLRMRNAEMFLKTPYLRIEEICRRCGYDDPAYFSRLFRKKYGISPMEYRRQFSGIVKP